MTMRKTLTAVAAAAIALGLGAAGLSCSSGSGLPPGTAICVGVSTPCEDIPPNLCGLAQGCAPGACSGMATACDSLTAASDCVLQEGCKWSTVDAKCGGTVEACSRFQSMSTCVGQFGCSWSAGCTGWPAECSALAVASCGAQPGCSIKVIEGGTTPVPDAGGTPDAPDVCSGALVPAAADMIDNMEDGDANVGPQPNWNGTWYVFHDTTATGQMVPDQNQPITMEPIPGGRCGSTRAMRMTGSGFDDWGSGMGMAFGWGSDVALPFDFHQYDGIVFWLHMGEGTSGRLRVNLLDKDTEPQGGVCDPNATAVNTGCYDHWGVALTGVGSEWKQYRVRFSELAQRNFGLPAPAFDPTTIYGIEFQSDPSVLFDVWVDDLAFTRP